MTDVATAEENLEEILRRATVAIVGGGSAVRISPLECTTVLHAVMSQDRVSLRYFCGAQVEATVVTMPGRKDGPAILVAEESHTCRSGPHGCTIALLNRDVDFGDALLVHGNVGSSEYFVRQDSSITATGYSFDETGQAILRVHGAALRAGVSGGPVLNRRTGGICGVVRLSDEVGSGHVELLGDEIVARSQPATAYDWTRALSDAQIIAGGWSTARRVVKAYAAQLLINLREHPYGVLLDVSTAPPLQSVYVKQAAEKAIDGGTRDLDEALANGGALTGDPGGGKSSAMRSLASVMCMGFQQRATSQLPIIVNAVDVVGDESLQELLHRAIARDLFSGETSRVHGLLNGPPIGGGKWHLMIDGFDEILDPRVRKQVLTRVLRETQPMGVFPAVLSVASRDFAIGQHRALLDEFKVDTWRLVPFEAEHAESLVRAWLAPAKLGRRRTNAVVDMVLSSFSRDVLSNPLSISLACQLILLRGQETNWSVPSHTTRNELFAQYLGVLIRRFYHSEGFRPFDQLRTRGERFGPESLEVALEYGETVFDHLARAALAWLSAPNEGLAQHLTDEFRPARPDPTGEWDKLMLELASRTGALTWHDQHAKFIHQVLGDYLASRAVATSPDLARKSLERLVAESILAENDSFIRFSVESLAASNSFWTWFAHSLLARPDALELGVLFLEDGVHLPPPAHRALLSRAAEALTASSDGEGPHVHLAISTMVLMGEVQLAYSHMWTYVRDPAVSPLVRRRFAAQMADLAENPDSPTREFAIVDDAGLLRASQTLLRLAPAGTISADDIQRALADLVPQSSTVAPDDDHDDIWSWIGRVVPKIFTRPRRWGNLETILRKVRAHHPKDDLGIIRRAYRAAKRAPAPKRAITGDPLIAQQLAAAEILAELGLGPRAIAAALLYRTSYGVEQLAAEFDYDVAMLVDGVTKLEKFNFHMTARAETARRIVMAMSEDIRILLIKLAYLLQAARSWSGVPSETTKRAATTTLEVYAVLAHQLGLQTIKSELESRAFAVLQPKLFAEIENLVNQRKPQRELYMQNLANTVQKDLQSLGIRGQVVGRPDEIYSLYKRMVVRGREFDDVYDLISARIIVESTSDCYSVLESVHARWTPLPGRFRDYIATPEPNGYQSLHTTIIGPGGRTVDIHIRTQEMHERAEYGVAAHWKYNRDAVDGGADAKVVEADMAWLAQMSSEETQPADPSDYLDSLQFEMGPKQVYVFTPKGKVVGLPPGATPVDFAYAIHTEVGHRTISAKVNGRPVPLNEVLRSADAVEVTTSVEADAGPNEDWLSFVRSPRARSKIRSWFAVDRREEVTEQGKRAIARAMRWQNVSLQRLAHQDAFPKVAQGLGYSDVSALYTAVGEGLVSAQSIVELLTTIAPASDSNRGPMGLPTMVRVKASDSAPFSEHGAVDMPTKLAKCCTPVPGDQIMGFITRANVVSVHRPDCPNFKSLMFAPERSVEVEWVVTSQSVFLVQIQVEAFERSGLLAQIVQVISEHHVRILSATVTTSDASQIISRFTFKTGDPAHLDRLLNAMRQVDGVTDADRVRDETEKSYQQITHGETDATASAPARVVGDRPPDLRGVRRAPILDEDAGVLVRGAPEDNVRLAGCCAPVPGDQIAGYIARGTRVSVHRADCPTFVSLARAAERSVEVEWAPTSRTIFHVQIQVDALDRAALIGDLIQVLSQHDLTILTAALATSDERLTVSRFTIKAGKAVDLDLLLDALLRVDGVYDVYRVTH